jgi:hypothetical protein
LWTLPTEVSTVFEEEFSVDEEDTVNECDFSVTNVPDDVTEIPIIDFLFISAGCWAIISFEIEILWNFGIVFEISILNSIFVKKRFSIKYSMLYDVLVHHKLTISCPPYMRNV